MLKNIKRIKGQNIKEFLFKKFGLRENYIFEYLFLKFFDDLTFRPALMTPFKFDLGIVNKLFVFLLDNRAQNMKIKFICVQIPKSSL